MCQIALTLHTQHHQQLQADYHAVLVLESDQSWAKNPLYLALIPTNIDFGSYFKLSLNLQIKMLVLVTFQSFLPLQFQSYFKRRKLRNILVQLQSINNPRFQSLLLVKTCICFLFPLEVLYFAVPVMLIALFGCFTREPGTCQKYQSLQIKSTCIIPIMDVFLSIFYPLFQLQQLMLSTVLSILYPTMHCDRL